MAARPLGMAGAPPSFLDCAARGIAIHSHHFGRMPRACAPFHGGLALRPLPVMKHEGGHNRR